MGFIEDRRSFSHGCTVQNRCLESPPKNNEGLGDGVAFYGAPDDDLGPTQRWVKGEGRGHQDRGVALHVVRCVLGSAVALLYQ